MHRALPLLSLQRLYPRPTRNAFALAPRAGAARLHSACAPSPAGGRRRVIKVRTVYVQFASSPLHRLQLRQACFTCAAFSLHLSLLKLCRLC